MFGSNWIKIEKIKIKDATAGPHFKILILDLQVLYPTDSLGLVCGQGNLQDRPYLLFFDLTRCLNPAILTMGCPTPQVCSTS